MKTATVTNEAMLVLDQVKEATARERVFEVACEFARLRAERFQVVEVVRVSDVWSAVAGIPEGEVIFRRTRFEKGDRVA